MGVGCSSPHPLTWLVIIRVPMSCKRPAGVEEKGTGIILYNYAMLRVERVAWVRVPRVARSPRTFWNKQGPETVTGIDEFDMILV